MGFSDILPQRSWVVFIENKGLFPLEQSFSLDVKGFQDLLEMHCTQESFSALSAVEIDFVLTLLTKWPAKLTNFDKNSLGRWF